MSIHKSKGLEFDAVAIVAVEHEMYFGKPGDARATFFVGISRAKQELLLTHAGNRSRPLGARRWSTQRTPHQEFLGYAYQSGATKWSGLPACLRIWVPAWCAAPALRSRLRERPGGVP